LTGWIPEEALAYNPPLAVNFFGTMILILLGMEWSPPCFLKRSKAEGSGWIVITAGGLRVMRRFTAIAAEAVDAHLNPR